MTEFSVTGGRPLRGRIRVPGDKSISHRAVLLAAVAEGDSVVRNLSAGDDVARTVAAVQAIGASVEGERISGGPSRLHEPEQVIDAGNSGTTMRLLAGLCAGFDWLTVITGDRSLNRRPMDRVAIPLRAMGAVVNGRGVAMQPPLVVRGGELHGIDYTPPVPSAQVKSAVLLAGLAAEGETVVRERVTTRVHTEEMLAACGALISVDDGGHTIRLQPSALTPFEIDVPGDPSQAAFWVVAACIVPGSEVVVEDVELGPARAGFLDVLERMGAAVEVESTGDHRGHITVRHRGAELSATEISGDEIVGLIDEIPALAVAAAVAKGSTVFSDAGELRVKESDRIATVASVLAEFGVDVRDQGDGLVISGTAGKPFKAARVQSHGDHRVAMAAAVAGMAAEGTTSVGGWEAVATSYPRFADDLRACAS